ncbi:MAG: HAMP domain-containing protein [Xanthomonadales bacterium]|nr:HAMP domain-containing protein [Xanthomonadales bacterium]
MRLRLWHRWFALTAALLLLALGVQAALQLQGFRHGLIDYLNQSEQARLHDMAGQLAAEYRHSGSWDRLLRQRWRWDEILRNQLGGEGPGPRRPRPGPPPAPRESDDATGPPPLRTRPPPPAALPPPAPAPVRPAGAAGDLAFPRRLSLLDAEGNRLLGRGASIDAVRESIQINGQIVGWLVLEPVRQAHGAADRDFVRSQSWQAIALALALLALALLVSWALARRLLRPVDALAASSRRWAQGDYAARAAVVGEHELADLAREFNGMAATLEQAREARSRWMADISHELRTPVAILRGELQALEDGIRPLDRTALASLLAETERLGRRIDELHELARSDSGAMHYRFGRVDLVELVRAAVDSQRGSLTEAGLQIELQLPDSAWLERADPDRLEQLLANLLSNARHYTDRGGQVQVQLQPESDNWLLQIDDSPPGVTPKELARLFERHWRGDATGRPEGAGLGLAICRNIVQAHGGEIEASASPLGGLRLRCRLPRRGGAH